MAEPRAWPFTRPRRLSPPRSPGSRHHDSDGRSTCCSASSRWRPGSTVASAGRRAGVADHRPSGTYRPVLAVPLTGAGTVTRTSAACRHRPEAGSYAMTGHAVRPDQRATPSRRSRPTGRRSASPPQHLLALPDLGCSRSARTGPIQPPRTCRSSGPPTPRPTRPSSAIVCVMTARSAGMTTGSSSSPDGPSTSSPTAPSGGPPRLGAATTPNPPGTPSSEPRTRSR